MIETVCKFCGKVFKKYPAGTQKFCSYKCYREWIRRDWKQKEFPEKIKCLQCGKVFKIFPCEFRDGRKFCSRKCKNKGTTYKRKIVRVPFTCPICNKTSLVIPSEKKKRKYCGIRCAHISQRKKSSFTCKTCGRVKVVHTCEAKKRKYCSREYYFQSTRNGNSIPYRHFKLILEYVNKLEKQGYKVVPITKVVPDIIAIKDGKVYAVEIESGIEKPNYKKYENSEIKKYIDDVRWIVIDKA